MKKHYAFIPLKEKDLSAFRRGLLIGISPRPASALFALLALGFIGYVHRDLLESDNPSLMVIALATAFVLYQLILEVHRVLTVARFQKSSLLPYIRVRGMDSCFYIEEVKDGFIIQIEPVNIVDINDSKYTLSEITSKFAESSHVADYLYNCMNSKNDRLINKAVIYVEIIRDQLEKGNKDILATYDKLQNFKQDL